MTLPGEPDEEEKRRAAEQKRQHDSKLPRAPAVAHDAPPWNRPVPDGPPRSRPDVIMQQPMRRPAGVDLEEQTEGYWQSAAPEDRQAYVTQLNTNYQTIVDELFELQTAAVSQFRDVLVHYRTSRRRMIWMTGALAILNIAVSAVAAQADNASFGDWLATVKIVAVVLPVLVAAYAGVIAIFSNIESLENYLQRAQLYRHARELSLTACRELEMLWHLYVRPFNDSPTACMNAASLYRRAVTKDQEVRGQLMEKPEKA
jgi:hypothetical protein